MYQTINFTLDSTRPLLMHNAQGVNPMHPLSKEKRAINAKKTKKTDEDRDRLIQIDWELGLYYDTEKKCPIIPNDCVEAMIRNAFRTIKKGKDVVSSISVSPVNIPLKYEGPKDIEALRKKIDVFGDVRNVKIQNSTIIGSRPRFNKWSIDIMVEFDDEVFNRDDIIRFMEFAGQKIGLCDYRPKYGTFTVRVNS